MRLHYTVWAHVADSFRSRRQRWARTSRAAWMNARELAYAKSGVYEPIVVCCTPEAQAVIDEMKTHCDDLAEEALKREMFVASALLCRFCEKAIKLAMIGAISANPYEPQITPDAVKWAAAFVAYATKQMLVRSAFYVAEGKFGKLKGRALAMMASHGGTIDRRTFLRNLNITVSTFKTLIATLLASELIDVESEPHGKTVYSLIK